MRLRSVGPGVAAALFGGVLGWLAVMAAMPHDDPPSATFVVRDDRIVATLHVELENHAPVARHYTITVAEPGDAILRSHQVRWRLEAGAARIVTGIVGGPRGGPTANQRRDHERGSQRISAVALPGQP